MFKPSRRAFGIASAFTLSAVILAPSASAALLGSGGQSSQALPVVSGLGPSLPFSGDLATPLGDLLGNGGLPVVGGMTSVDGADSSGADVLSPITDTTLACDAAVPQVLRALVLGDLADTICEPFDGGLLGVLTSL